MNNEDGDVRDRLAALEARVARIETLLQQAVPPQRAEDRVPPAPAMPAAVPYPDERSPHPPPLSWQRLEAEVAPAVEPVPVLSAEPMGAAPPAEPEVIPYAAPPPPLPPPPRGDFEQTIGLKWAGWIGAIALVVGAGMGIKFAVDQGWLGQVPAAVRLGLMYIGGFGILAAGEIVYRRVNVISAAALFGAGVATLFLVSYAGHGLYKLYEPGTAFVLMAASTLVGAAVAVRGKLVSIAILSLIGGNIAPLVVGESNEISAFLSYLLMLQVVALVLAWWGTGGKWWILRSFSFVTTSLWMIGVLASPEFRDLREPLVFALVYASLFQAEVIASAIRSRRLGTTSGTMFSMIVTAAAMVAVLYISRNASPTVRAAWVIGFAVVGAILGFTMSLRGPASLRAIAIGFRIQAAALLVVAVPVALDGPWVTIGWGILALAFAALGAVMELNVSRAAGMATWALAIANLVGWATHRDTADEARAAWLTLLREPIEAFAVIAAVMTAVGHAIACLVAFDRDRTPRERRTWAMLTSVVAGVVWSAASIAALPPLGATASIVVYAWLLLGADRLLPAAGYVWHAFGGLAIAAVKWVIVDTLMQRAAPNWQATQYQPLFNPAMAVGSAIALSLMAMYWLRRRELNEWLRPAEEHEGTADTTLLLGVIAAVFVIFTLGLTLEVDRVIEQRIAGGAISVWPPGQVKHLSWTMLWMTSAVGFIALAAKLEPRPDRARERTRSLAVVPLVLVGKFLVVDTLAFHLLHRRAPAAVFVNLEMLAALFVIGGTLWTIRMCIRPIHETDPQRLPIASILGFMSVLVVLWMGTLEIDRYFERAGGINADRAKQLAFSIYWGLFAIACVVAGFRFRIAGLRYFGLGLFAVTLLKIVLIDLAELDQGYRILSFMGVGILLLGTSVLYGKLSPKLLKEP